MKEIMSITAGDLQEILDITPLDQAIMLIGNKGIGKSQILTEFHKNRGMRVQAFFLGQLSDPGDVIGLPRKNEKTGITEYLPPFWWPVDNEPIALFFDELNKARNEILNAVQDCVLNHTLMGRSLPEGSRVIAAVNWGDNYDVNDLDDAMLSRFNIYHFDPTVMEWLEHAKKKEVDERIIRFITEKEIYLDGTGKEQEAEEVINSPDRRAWFKVNDIIKGREVISTACWKAVTGQIGVSAQGAFKAYIDQHLKSIPLQELLYAFDEGTVDKLRQMELQDLLYLNKDIMLYLKTKKIGETDAQQIAVGVGKYMDFLKKTEQFEVMAEFTAMSKDNNEGMALVMAVDSSIFMRMQETISDALIS